MYDEYEPNPEEIRDILSMFAPAVHAIEATLKTSILSSRPVLVEAIMKAEQEIYLLSQKGPPSPNCFKRGACFAVWIGRLKPYRATPKKELALLYQDETVSDLVSAIRSGIDLTACFPQNRIIFANELVANIIGLGLSEKGEEKDEKGNVIKTHSIEMADDVFHDVIIGLRYGHFTTEALSLLYQGSSVVKPAT